MKLRHSLITAGLVTALSCISIAAYANDISAQDFVTKASVANKFEIDSSKVALNKSSNDGVKTFAQQMIDDHGTAAKNMDAALANSQSHAQPATALDDKHQHQLDTLKAADSKDFDKQYISIQTDAHHDALKLFSNYAHHGDDTSLVQFAKTTLPTLKQHMQHVKQLQTTQAQENSGI